MELMAAFFILGIILSAIGLNQTETREFWHNSPFWWGVAFMLMGVIILIGL